MQALEISHFRRIASFHQRFKTGLHQFYGTTTQYGLLAKQVCFRFFTEISLDHPALGATNSCGVRKRNVFCLAGFILIYRNQRWHTAALQIFGANCMTRAFWRYHNYVQIGTWDDLIIVNIKAVGER